MFVKLHTCGAICPPQGTVPVTLEVGKAREVQEAHDKSRMLASSNRHASSKRGSIHHHGRVVLMTTEEPIQVVRSMLVATCLHDCSCSVCESLGTPSVVPAQYQTLVRKCVV